MILIFPIYTNKKKYIYTYNCQLYICNKAQQLSNNCLCMCIFHLWIIKKPSNEIIINEYVRNKQTNPIFTQRQMYIIRLLYYFTYLNHPNIIPPAIYIYPATSFYFFKLHPYMKHTHNSIPPPTIIPSPFPSQRHTVKRGSFHLAKVRQSQSTTWLQTLNRDKTGFVLIFTPVDIYSCHGITSIARWHRVVPWYAGRFLLMASTMTDP